MDLDSEPKLISLIYPLLSRHTTDAEDVLNLIQLFIFVSSMDLDLLPKPESELMSLVTQAISVFHSMVLDSQPEPLLEFIRVISQKISFFNSMDTDYEPISDSKLKSLAEEAVNLEPQPELISLINQILISALRMHLKKDMDRFALIEEKKKFRNILVSDLEPEPKIISLISHLSSLDNYMQSRYDFSWKTEMLLIELVSVVSSMDLESQPKPESQLMSLITQATSVFHSMDLDSQPELLLKLISLISENLSLPDSMDSDYEPIPDLKILTLALEVMDLNPKPVLLSPIFQILDPAGDIFGNSTDEESGDSERLAPVDEEKNFRNPMNSDWEPERKLISLISQLTFIYNLLPEEAVLDAEFESASEFFSLIMKIISQVKSLDLKLQPEPESKLISLTTQAISVFNSLDLNRQPKELRNLISNLSNLQNLKFSGLGWDSNHLKIVWIDVNRAMRLTRKPKLISLINQIISLFITKDSEPMLFALIHPRGSLHNSIVSDSEPESESLGSVELSHKRESGDLEFFSFIHNRNPFHNTKNSDLEPEIELLKLISQLTCPDPDSQFISVLIRTIFMVSSLDFDSKPKPESELISLITRAIFVFNSMDLNAQPEPLRQLISLISQKLSLLNSIDREKKSWSESDEKFMSLVFKTVNPKPEPELISIIHQIYSLVNSMNSASGKHNFLCAQLDVRLDGGKFHVTDEDKWRRNSHWFCNPVSWERLMVRKGEDAAHFLCRSCYGENHKFNKAPVEIKHHFHPKHSLQLALLSNKGETRKCYCCNEDLIEIFYYCSVCDFAMNVACVEKPPLLSAIVHPKWHEHTLALFSRQTPLACNLCAVADLSAPIYMCPPCGFVVHLRCLNLPRVIRISRHPYRISFTPSFNQEDLSCRICRTKIDSEYGGYSCIKDGFSYMAHSRCATQRNVWDGEELEGELEETEEEEFEPFVRISDGIIGHFSHGDHYMSLNDNMDEDYDENKQCQICITPIYFGNFYFCITCEFVLHETCGNLSRKMHHPTHPHRLTLVGGYDGVTRNVDQCSVCHMLCTVGFFYKCFGKGCDFKLHAWCATFSEPLVHGSHIHPLFLTSKPGDRRICWICKDLRYVYGETFNCIECEFAMCFKCVIVPQKVRYTHDKHMMTLCDREETSTKEYWCEACEVEMDPKNRFYKCDEYCCVTLHISCLFGRDIYMKVGSSWFYYNKRVCVMPNNQRMSRPFCDNCKERCPDSIVIKIYGTIYCCVLCMHGAFSKRRWLY